MTRIRGLREPGPTESPRRGRPRRRCTSAAGIALLLLAGCGSDPAREEAAADGADFRFRAEENGRVLEATPAQGATTPVRIEAALRSALDSSEILWAPTGSWNRRPSGGYIARLENGGRPARLVVTAEPDGALRISPVVGASCRARFLRLRLEVPGLDRVFDPDPTWTYELESTAGEARRQDILDGPGRFGGDWIFTPPPFVFAVRSRSRWTAIGLGAEAGRLDFTRVTIGGTPPALELEIDFGRRRDLSRPLPAVWIRFGDADRYTAIGRHLARSRPPTGRTPGPLWWRLPIFCGWGEQLVRARLNHAEGSQADYSRRTVYEDFLKQLELRDLKPGILTIDDKWQQTYGGLEPDPEKWPDLAGFIARCHARGLRVLLWLPLWHPEGLPPEWCFTREGKPYKADPRHPGYLRHLSRRIRFLLGADGLDADGLKVDWTNQGPWELTDHAEEIWGVELLRRYHAAVYKAAKSVKPRALVITHAFHPAFLGHGDMLRLNDIMRWCPDVVGEMRHRARMARLLDPAVPVDCDNCSMPDRRQWLDYMAIQPELGVPSLYFLTHVDGSLEPIRDTDWKGIRETWARYRASLGE
jgi:hypothetical protein